MPCGSFYGLLKDYSYFASVTWFLLEKEVTRFSPP